MKKHGETQRGTKHDRETEKFWEKNREKEGQRRDSISKV